MAIGELITQKDFQSMANMNTKFANGYIAPSIWRLQNGTNSYAYFKSINTALRRYLILNKIDKGADVKADGIIKFTGTATATLGINVDFFGWSQNLGVYPISYADVRAAVLKSKLFNCLCRFYKTDGTAPYYTVFHAGLLGISANVAKGLTPEKIALLDEYQRQLKIAQLNFNLFSTYINKLKSVKLKGKEWNKYEAAVLKRAQLETALQQLVSAKEVDIKFKKVSKVGIIGVDDIIIIAIVATVAFATYATVEHISSNERIKTINASYNFQQFITEQNRQIAIDEAAGKYSKATADALRQQNNTAANAAQTIIDKTVEAGTAASNESIFDKVQNILLIGGGFYIASKFIK